jgi:hypothetical protein
VAVVWAAADPAIAANSVSMAISAFRILFIAPPPAPLPNPIAQCHHSSDYAIRQQPSRAPKETVERALAEKVAGWL